MFSTSALPISPRHPSLFAGAMPRATLPAEEVWWLGSLTAGSVIILRPRLLHPEIHHQVCVDATPLRLFQPMSELGVGWDPGMRVCWAERGRKLVSPLRTLILLDQGPNL